MALNTDLREFIELLNSNDVDYVIVGGHAVGFHGWPRFTKDVDVFVRPTSENAQRLVTALDAFGFGTVGLTPESFTTVGQVVQLGQPPNRIDILTGISAVDFDEAWTTRVAAHLDGIPVSILGKEQLLRNKKAAGRPEDLADIAKLEKIDGSKGAG